ncbi:hypothetical protein IGI04_003977 [Brassica rapa subsp. trilocularis]|uniref:Uncharacterized protein n=1 Tax=Brassica rapa subsp. trilocularis TaxID=1813537 RepID=A0ABQ7P1Z7_BRACM|nr:hypothetical protein IGI04_003977 [Brassica rapa subsp. trilocularis]
MLQDLLDQPCLQDQERLRYLRHHRRDLLLHPPTASSFLWHKPHSSQITLIYLVL